MLSEVEVLGTFPNIEIVGINRPDYLGGRSRYHKEYDQGLVSVHLSNGQDICFNEITDCCASVSLRTDISEFKELIGKKLASLIFVKSEYIYHNEYGEYSTYYYYKFVFSDNTEFEFDFDGFHGNGGYYAAHVDVTISDIDGNVKKDE